MGGSDQYNQNMGGFKPAENAWGFQNNGGAAFGNEDDDLDDEERERVEKAEADWEDKKRQFFEFG